MTNTYSIAEARDQFTTLVHDLQHQPLIRLTRRGKPVAVLLSIEEYERLSMPKLGFWQAYNKFRHDTDLATLAIDSDLFTERDPSPGREVAW
ncbi:MAG: type II toxin-antitoxin system Phd/YefM family antitoxin [Chloroflexi bacterium]|nr:type II toxin-antitoxin system Phd/YefM family antitoxin [Chloroflexota bacterium]MBP8055979.1 type II toxin-antitoxin system Phd/YefM family antitoxin [Chloroflexota bacterium]